MLELSGNKRYQETRDIRKQELKKFSVCAIKVQMELVGGWWEDGGSQQRDNGGESRATVENVFVERVERVERQMYL